MSLTGVSSLVTSWIEHGLEWRYFWRPAVKPFTIPAGGQVQIPSEGFTFKAPEGILRTFNAAFDHPACGIRFEAYPELDTREFFTVDTMAIALSNMATYVTSLIPPQTPPGIYTIAQNKDWAWKEWTRLYLFNPDSIDHKCIGYAYTMLLLKEPRKEAEKVT